MISSNDLKEWIVEQNVRERVIRYFWKCFKNYQREEPEEFSGVFGDFHADLLELPKSVIALKIRNWEEFDTEYNENHEFIEAYIDIVYKDRKLGYYSLLFNFDGTIFDDYFVLG